jgi:hypothetical protein
VAKATGTPRERSRVGKRKAGIAGKVHVEDRAVKLPNGERQPVRNRAGRPHDPAAELAEPILNQH